MNQPILIEIGAGELIDRITILEIKSERIKDVNKLEHINRELETLRHCRKQVLGQYSALAYPERELKNINERLWIIEDKLRIHERESEFNELFVLLARCVYQDNDKRAEMKRLIDSIVDSRMSEQKSYGST